MLFVILGLQFFPAVAEAQQSPEAKDQEKEAPEALFGFQLADQEVELFLKGWWNLGTRLGIGVAVDEQGWWSGWTPSDVAAGFQFYQSPNLDLKLLIDKRWLVRATYSANNATNALLFGYQGKEPETLRFANVGTFPLSIQSAAHTPILPNRQGTPAANLGLGFTNGWAQTLVQYEPRTDEVKRYQGRREVVEVTLPPQEWIKRRFYRLPGTSWPGIEFLAESQGLPRSLDPGEVLFELTTGVVEIPTQRAETYLVRWSGMVVGLDPITGNPLETKVIGSTTWLVLSSGLKYAPLELKNRYALPAELSAQAYDLDIVFTRRQEPVAPPSFLNVSLDWEKKIVVVESSAPPGKDYPFFNFVPRLYEPSGQALAEELALTLRFLKKEEGFNLGSGVQPDSVRVWRNGQAFTNFRFQANTGQIEILETVLSTDRWEVRYLKQTPESGSARLFAWQTARFDLDEASNMQLALGMSWPLDQTAFTTQDNQAPGYGLVKFLYQNVHQDLFWEWELGGRMDIPDSTGERLWADFGQESSKLYLETSILRVGSLPPQDSGWGLDNPGNVVSLTLTNRGRLRYRNFFERDTFGNLFLKPWGAPGVNPLPYVNEGRSGPYLALADSTTPQRSVVLEYELEPTQRWVSAQLFLNQGASVDWTTVRRLRFRHRLQGTSTQLNVYLLMGSLGEDADGTQQIRPAQAIEGVAHLPFTDLTNALQLNFPLPDGRPVNTAWQGRTWYQAPVTAQVVARNLTLPGSTWSTVTIDLTPEEARRLSKANSLQLVLVSSVANTQSGVYQMTDIQWEGSRTLAQAVPPATQDPSVREDEEKLIIVANQGPYTTRTVLSRLTLPHYQLLTFRFYLSSGPNPTHLRVKAVDFQGKGLSWDLSVSPQSQWRTVELDWENKKAILDGTETGSVTWDPDAQALTDLVIEYQDTAAMELWVSDVRALKARMTLSATTRALMRWQTPTTTVEAEIQGNTQQQFRLYGLWRQNLGPWSSWISGNLSYDELWRFDLSYREELRLPLLWFGDAFMQSGERQQWVGLSLPFLGRIESSLSLRWVGWSVSQQFQLRSNSVVSELLGQTLTPALLFQWDQTYFAKTDFTKFEEIWLWSTQQLYILENPGLLRRQAQIKPTLRFQLGRLESWAEVLLEAQQRPAAGTTLIRTYRPEWGLRWGFWEEVLPLTLSVGASRRLSREQANQGSLLSQDFLERWSQSWPNDLPQLVRPPFQELLAPASEFWDMPDPLTPTTYSGTLQLGLNRAPLIGRLDFFLPQLFQTQLEATQRFQTQLQPSRLDYSLQLQWLSVNQFGRLSSEPLTTLYDQDEFNTLLRWDYKRQPPTTDEHTLNLLQSLALRWELIQLKLEQFTSTTLGKTWSWKGVVSAQWDFPVDFPLHIPYMRTPRDFQERFLIVFLAETVWSGPKIDRLPLQKILLRPSTEWKFHPNGSVIGTLTTALEQIDPRTVVGVELNLELRFLF